MRTSRLSKERFEAKVAAGPGCMLWMGARGGGGYGNLRVDGKVKAAHRIAYQLYKGVIPAGTEIDHLCRNLACVNVDHLEAVPHRVNCQRGTAGSVVTIRQRSKTHRPRGHAYNEANTYIDRFNRRRCRACGRIADRQRRPRRR